MVNCQLRNYFKGRGRKNGRVRRRRGGVDLALGFKNFWDGVYNFFFAPPSLVSLIFVHTRLLVSAPDPFTADGLHHDPLLRTFGSGESLVA